MKLKLRTFITYSFPEYGTYFFFISLCVALLEQSLIQSLLVVQFSRADNKKKYVHATYTSQSIYFSREAICVCIQNKLMEMQHPLKRNTVQRFCNGIYFVNVFDFQIN